jgi:hypothetical protein
MPHFALHMHLASRVLEGWRGGTLSLPCPFDVEDPTAANAFYHGAIGPDMGFFPGGEHLLSQAAHVVRSGDLARTLMGTAATPTQRAFAYGWMTHMLGDVLIHPVINSAAADLLDRDRCPRTDAWHQNAHIRVELGLDAVYVARYAPLRRMRLRPFFDAATAVWVTDAFRTVHGVDFAVPAVLRSHQQVVRLQRPLLLLERLIAVGRGPGHPMRRALARVLTVWRRLAEWRLGPHSSVTGFLNTVRPPGPVVRTVDGMADMFHSSYSLFVRMHQETTVSYSLDTGELDGPGTHTREGVLVRKELAALRAGQATSAVSHIAASA